VTSAFREIINGRHVLLDGCRSGWDAELTNAASAAALTATLVTKSSRSLRAQSRCRRTMAELFLVDEVIQ
jgi:hypothetical protein